MATRRQVLRVGSIRTPAEAQIRGLSQVQFFPLSHMQTVAGAMRL